MDGLLDQFHNNLEKITMKLRFLELDIRMSELHTQRVCVASWEHPVLQAVWGAGVSVVNEVLIERKAPEPEDEFRRLANRYGSPEVEGAPYVAAVYGQFGPGVNSLARAIEDAIYEGDVETTVRPAGTVPAAGAVPAGISRPISEIEAELAEAKRVAAKLAEEQQGGARPLTFEEVQTVKAASPEVAEQVHKFENQSDVQVDDAIADIV